MKWKHINGFENLYEVSNDGNIRSIARVIVRSNGRQHTIKQTTLKPAIDKCGYKRVALMKNGSLKTRKVHRLVAENFQIRTPKTEVNHIDGNKLNNNAANLEWVTRSQNVKHAFDAGLSKPLRGSDNPSAIIDEMQALTIKTLILSGEKLINISRRYGISYNIIKDINRKKTWKHV